MIWILALLIAQQPSPATLDQYGKAHDPDRLGERLVVLDFAASWCQPCWKALPRLEALAADRPELAVLVVSQDETRKGRDRLVRKLGLTVPVLWDEGHRWAARFEPEGMPTTMILDGDGTVLHRHTGSSERGWHELLAVLDRLATTRAAPGTR